MNRTIGRVAYYCRLSREEQGKNIEIFENKYKELMSKIKSQIERKQNIKITKQEVKRAIRKYIMKQKERTTY